MLQRACCSRWDHCVPRDAVSMCDVSCCRYTVFPESGLYTAARASTSCLPPLLQTPRFTWFPDYNPDHPAGPKQNLKCLKRRVPRSPWYPITPIQHHSAISEGVLIGRGSPVLNSGPDRCYVMSGWLVLRAADRSDLFFWVFWFQGWVICWDRAAFSLSWRDCVEW